MFTYFQSSIGAFLLHIATSTHLYGNGKVFGCSSMLYNSIFSPSVFSLPTMAGVLSSVLLSSFIFPQYLPSTKPPTPFTDSGIGSTGVRIGLFGAVLSPLAKFLNSVLPAGILSDESLTYGLVLLCSGFLTGLGTCLGSGCTSGHMLCGLARFSKRSFVATCVFSCVAMLTQFILKTAPDYTALSVRGVLGDEIQKMANYAPVTPSNVEIFKLLGLVAVLYSVSTYLKSKAFSDVSKVSSDNKKNDDVVQASSYAKAAQATVSFFSGLTFGLGLLISGMSSPATTLGFLAMPEIATGAKEKFNPSLIMVILFGIIPNALEIMKRPIFGSPKPEEKSECDHPSCCTKFDVPQNKIVDSKLILGAVIFGLGWGSSGICPGPGVLKFGVGILELCSRLVGTSTNTGKIEGMEGIGWLAAFIGGYWTMKHIQ